ncbi:MAG: hypothetical protein K0Q94_3695, partial [Paenibacillus sp.]|nr:hypothetical protein [Paenibacillus sp.]
MSNKKRPDSPQPSMAGISRRKLITSLGLAGAALAAGGMYANALGDPITELPGSRGNGSGVAGRLHRRSGAGLLTELANADTIDDLRDLSGMSDGDTAVITSTGRAGFFRWSSADLSANVAADPQSGLYVAPAGQTGNLGAWIRIIENGTLLPQYFGFQEGMNASNLAALQAAMNAAAAIGAELFVPAGTYYGNLETR